MEGEVTLIGGMMLIVGIFLMLSPLCGLGLVLLIVGFLIFIIGLVTEFGPSQPEEVVVYLPAQPQHPAERPVASRQQRFCTNCGTEIEPTDRFCGLCGTRIR